MFNDLLAPKPCLCVAVGGQCVDNGVHTPSAKRLAREMRSVRQSAELTDEQREQILAMPRDGVVDSAIAAAVGCTPPQVSYHRKKNGIVRRAGGIGKQRIGGKLAGHEELVAELHGRKLTDREMVDELAKRGIMTSKAALCKWRKRLGLKAHFKGGRHSGKGYWRAMDKHAALISEWHVEGKKDREIVSELARIGIESTKVQVCNWRASRGIQYGKGLEL